MMQCFKLPIILTILISNVIGIPPPTPSFASTNFVVTSTEPTNKDAAAQGEAQKPSAPPELNSMHVECNITNRYAHTVISSRYKNPADIAQEATFSINLPETAFISGFTMEIKGKVYEAYVKEKEEAKKDYEHAVQSGFAAAHIEQSARDSNKFKVSVNVEPRSKVIFNLSYEQLLVRKHGKYEMIMNLQPGQLVKDLTVDVLINETKPLINVVAPALRSGNEIYEENINKTNEYAQITKIGDDGKCVKIHFAPTVQQQKEMTKSLEALAEKKRQNNNPYYEDPSFYQEQNQQNKKEKDALSGQFVVEYDVDRNSKGGDVLVNDGYFVHFFAPSDLKPIPKHAVFVLDVSGSMAGRKIEQVKQAMQVILDELNPEDYFNLIEFSFGAKAWNLDNPNASTTYDKSRNPWWRPAEEEKNEPEIPFELPPAFPATDAYKQQAKNIIQNMEAFGGTNIYDALNVALNLTSQGVPENKERKREPEPIIVFLTDGEATDGPTDSKIILNTVDELNNEENKAAIFSLSFGFDANKDLLKKLSLRNLGFMRQIYEASDAALQLQDFYKQISSPLLSNVTFSYPEGEVESVTKHNFHTLFDGGEFVVAGKMENPKDKILYVHGFTYDGPIDFPPSIIPIPNQEEVKQPTGPLERLWAYLTIKQLLDKKDEISDVDNNSTEAEELGNKALKLALKYSFVTPVTSLVVVKPNETEKVNADEANPPGFDGHAGAFLSASAGAGGFGGGFYSASPPGAGGAFAGTGGAFGGAGAPGSFSPDSGFGGGSFGSASGFGGSYDAYPMSQIGSIQGQGIGGGIGRSDPNSFSGMPFPNYPPLPTLPERDLSPAYVSGPYQPASIDPYQPAIPADVDVPGLPWVSSLAFNQFMININNTMYNVGNNETIINETPCEVDNIKGNCTLLPICTKMHSVLVSYETYFPKYFCNLELGYAGVCCLAKDEEKHN